MTDCDRLRYDIGAYVLGALEADDSERVRRHLHECPECVAELDMLAPLPELLTIAGGAKAAQEEPLPAAFEERLLDAYARDRAAEPPRRTRRRRLPRLRRRLRVQWMAAGAVAAVAAAALAIVVVGGGEEAPGYDVAFRNTAFAPGASAHAALESADEGTELHLWVYDLPRDPSVVYEVVCEAPTWKASAGTFRVGRDGGAYVVLNTAAKRGEYDAIRIVRRGRDGARDVLQARLS